MSRTLEEFKNYIWQESNDHLPKALKDLIESLTESINDKFLFKSVFLGGSPGAGKTFIGEELFKGTGAVFVNSDKFLEFLLKKADLPFDLATGDPEVTAKQQALRGLAKKLTMKKTAFWLDGMLPLILDGTSADVPDILKKKKTLEDIGYDTNMAFVNTSLDVALDRNKTRPRQVPEKLVKKLWDEAQKARKKYKSVFGKNYIEIDNNEFLKGVELQKLGTELRRAALKFLAKPLKNKTGQKLIKVVQAAGGLNLSDVGVDVSRTGLR